MAEERAKKAAIKTEEISASLVALEGLRSIPPPPPQESITLASAIAKLAPAILDLLNAGYSIEMIAERVKLGGKHIEAAALKRYLAQHARQIGSRRQKRGTTSDRSRAPRLRKSSSATAARTDASNSTGETTEAKLPLAAFPAIPSHPLSVTEGVVKQPVVFPTVPQDQEVKAQRAPLETSAAPVMPSQPLAETPFKPQPVPPSRVEGAAATAVQRPPASPNISPPPKFESGRGQPQLNLLNAATARMNRPPPPGFEEFSGSGSKPSSEPDDPPF